MSGHVNTSQSGPAAAATAAAAEAAPAPTLGRRLERSAQRIASRHLPGFTWTRPLLPLMRKITALPVPAARRFQRVELPVLAPYYRPADPDPEPVEAPNRTTRAAAPVLQQAPVPAATEQRLPPQVLGRLQDVVGPAAAKALHVHDGPAADAMARHHSAAAVTIGRDVYFQQGRLRPHDDAGLALLAHEATHVMQYLASNPDWRRATQSGTDEHEREAAAIETGSAPPAPPAPPTMQAPPLPSPLPAPPHAARTARSLPPGRWTGAVPQRGQAPPTAGAAIGAGGAAAAIKPTAASPALKPMAAAADRSPTPTPSQTPLNVDALREQLFRDLMARIKSDQERGA